MRPPIPRRPLRLGSCALALLLIAPQLTAATPLIIPKTNFDDIKLPAHPTLLFAEYHQERLAVIAADKDQPVVVIDGQRVTLPENTPLLTQRAAAYTAGSADIGGGVTQRIPMEVQPTPGTPRRHLERFELELTIKADRDLSDCYLVLIGFDADALEDPEIPDSSTISVREIGSLKAGEEKSLHVDSSVLFPLRYANGNPWKDKQDPLQLRLIAMPLVWQLFSGGIEVKTNVSSTVPVFFYHRERMVHHLAVAAWRKQNRSGNHGAEPLLQIPPLLDSTAGFPPQASATLSIGADGRVTKVVLDQPFPEPAKDVLTTTLGAWLFLPAIKNGVPIATRVRIPLDF